MFSPEGFSVEESFPLSTSFANVSASDGDGLGQISYSLSTTSDVFVVDNTTGSLFLAQTLDFETLYVDHGLNPQMLLVNLFLPSSSTSLPPSFSNSRSLPPSLPTTPPSLPHIHMYIVGLTIHSRWRQLRLWRGRCYLV